MAAVAHAATEAGAANTPDGHCRAPRGAAAGSTTAGTDPERKDAPQMQAPRPPAVTTYHVHSHRPGTGRILAVFTDGPADLAVARHTAALAARTAAPVVAAAVVHRSGFSINPLLHRVRARRLAAETAAITARVEPTLRRANTRVLVTSLVLPARHRTDRPPSGAIHDLAVRVGAGTVVVAPFDVPAYGLCPVSARPDTRADSAHPPPPAATVG